jgi:hypothetical protein
MSVIHMQHILLTAEGMSRAEIIKIIRKNIRNFKNFGCCFYVEILI